MLDVCVVYVLYMSFIFFECFVSTQQVSFKKFAPLLTRRGIPLRQKGRVYRSCVQSVMVYASETWAVRVEEEQRMERKENVMLKWMCGVTFMDKVSMAELRRRLKIEGVMEVEAW